MVIFEKITAQNFMSIGNIPLSIDLNKSQSTLITGKNGAGKSQIIEALCFSLYGKPYRNINKPNLCNSVNGKKCLVEVEFNTNGKNYKVRRGLKPTVFEIFEDEKLLNQDADSRDYQKILEQQILKMNFRAFTQVVVIGTAAFVPFMNLKPEHRREFIEDLLDIRVFSVMNKTLSVKMKETKDTLKTLNSDIQSSKEIIQVIESHVDGKKEEIQEKIRKATSEKVDIASVITEFDAIRKTKKEELVLLKSDIDQYRLASSNHEQCKKKMAQCSDSIGEISLKLRDTNHVCSGCGQDMPEELLCKITNELKEKIRVLDEKYAKLSKEEIDLKTLVYDISGISEKAKVIEKEVSELNEKIYGNTLLLKKIEKDISDLNDELRKDSPDKSKLKDVAKKLIFMIKTKKELVETQQLQLAAQTLLHDTGVKAKIIKQYIPTINKLVNKYLNKLDLFVNFNLDENFNEVVKSRHRDMFTYDSFSEGEKTRISLALIFTWRAIAAMKNSVNSNLIILDEIADASMDTEGFDQCVNLFHSMKNNNVFVVSHREIISDKFDQTLKFEKKNNFTAISV